MTELLKGYTEAVETALYNFIPKEKTKGNVTNKKVTEKKIKKEQKS